MFECCLKLRTFVCFDSYLASASSLATVCGNAPIRALTVLHVSADLLLLFDLFGKYQTLASTPVG
jgi:hypothetical protein